MMDLSARSKGSLNPDNSLLPTRHLRTPRIGTNLLADFGHLSGCFEPNAIDDWPISATRWGAAVFSSKRNNRREGKYFRTLA